MMTQGPSLGDAKVARFELSLVHVVQTAQWTSFRMRGHLHGPQVSVLLGS